LRRGTLTAIGEGGGRRGKKRKKKGEKTVRTSDEQRSSKHQDNCGSESGSGKRRGKPKRVQRIVNKKTKARM